jgi:hypothetical protein
VKMVAGDVAVCSGASLCGGKCYLVSFKRNSFLTFMIASVHMYHNTQMMSDDNEPRCSV